MSFSYCTVLREALQNSLAPLCITLAALKIVQNTKKKVGDRLRATGVSRTYVEPE